MSKNIKKVFKKWDRVGFSVKKKAKHRLAV